MPFSSQQLLAQVVSMLNSTADVDLRLQLINALFDTFAVTNDYPGMFIYIYIASVPKKVYITLPCKAIYFLHNRDIIFFIN